MARTLRFASLLWLFGVPRIGAQLPTDPLERRFRFAELFAGVDVSSMPAGAVPDASPGALRLPARTVPRVTIAGLHFWGHADFAVTFPLSRGARGEGPQGSWLTTGVETRGRWYLRPARTAGLSPFVGGGLGAMDLQVGDGPRLYRMQPMGQAGVVWRTGRTLVELGWSWRPPSTVAYAVSRTATQPVRPAPHAVFFGVHHLTETTAELIEPIRSGAWGERERALRAAGRLSGPTLALGVSSPILTGSGAFNRERRPFLAERPRGLPMLDVGLGWHLDAMDAHVNLAWRQSEFPTDAFGFAQRLSRQSLTVEAFKFLGDWHGFVPFVGPAIGVDRLRMRETDGGAIVTDASRRVVAPGITFGWDIRPTRAQRVVLRTNLRWFPALRLPHGEGTATFDQLEFNFIQLVWYPRR